MTSRDEVLAAMRQEIGQVSEPGEWFTVDQALIDRYVAISGEDTWIHTDPDKARRETAFGNTIAPGNMGIALMPRLSRTNSAYSRYPRRYSLNQGWDRITNTLADVYMEYSIEGQVEAAKRAYKWVTERLAETQTGMEQAQDKLLKSYQGQDLFVPEGSVSAITTSITKLTEDHIQAQARRIELEAQLGEFQEARFAAAGAPMRSRRSAATSRWPRSTARSSR